MASLAFTKLLSLGLLLLHWLSLAITEIYDLGTDGRGDTFS
jgi:hypothetical protein